MEATNAQHPASRNGGEGIALHNPLNHSLDGLTPSSIESPKTLDELSSTLANASSSAASVIPWGGGTRIGIGNIPSSYDLALDLSGYSAQLEHVAGDMTVIVDSGVTISAVNAVLNKERQRLPFEVLNPETATIGGSIASNAPARRQSSTGGIRDWVIGMQIVLANGTVTKTGGRVVKNVQGYDMHRLHTGAYGTLGIVSQAAFKLIPTTPVQKTVVAWFDDVQMAREVGLNLANGSFAPEVISLISGPLASASIEAVGEATHNGEPTTSLIVRLGGGERSIERQVNEVTGTAGAGGATGYAVLDGDSAQPIWSALEKTESSAEFAIRVTARTTETLDISQSLLSEPTNADNVSTICDLGFGAMTAVARGLSEHQAMALTGVVGRAISKSGGSYVIEKCPLALKQQIDVFSDVGSSIDVMRRIKNQYDPNNILNPGRFVARI